MTVSATRPPVRQARLAVYALFGSFGILLSTWAVHLPSLKHTVGMSTSMVGTMLLVLGVGAIIGMQITGVLVDRFGCEAVSVFGGVLMALALSAPLAAQTVGQALAGALLFGVTAGTADIAMNAAAVNVQRDYERPVMASFHGMYSVGAVVGSSVGAAGFALNIHGVGAALAVGAACLVIVACAARGLRGRYRGTGSVPRTQDPQPGTSVRNRRRHVLVLGVLAFLLLLSEGIAMDWASLHAQQRLGASASTGALTVAAFIGAMMLCRFTVDRVTGRFGPVRVLRVGSVVAAVGILIVIAGDSVPVVIGGWIVFGLGLAGGAPQVLTAAGNLGGGRSGRDLSRVVGAGYVAILAGPATIGWLIELVSWTAAFLVPLAAVLVCAVGASAVVPDGDPSGPV